MVENHEKADFVIASLLEKENVAFGTNTGSQNIFDATIILEHCLEEIPIVEPAKYQYSAGNTSKFPDMRLNFSATFH